MFTIEADDVHQVASPVYPAVALAVQMALSAYQNRTGPITAEQFERLFRGVTIPNYSRKWNLDMGTAALMMATALQTVALLEQNAGLVAAKFASDEVAAEVSERAGKAMETVVSLGALADQFGSSGA
jgi:hypothetical protein